MPFSGQEIKNPAARGEAKRRGRNREEADSFMVSNLETVSSVWSENYKNYFRRPGATLIGGIVDPFYAFSTPLPMYSLYTLHGLQCDISALRKEATS